MIFLKVLNLDLLNVVNLFVVLRKAQYLTYCSILIQFSFNVYPGHIKIYSFV